MPTGAVPDPHGQFTLRTKTGTASLAFERGVIESVAVSVRAADGTTWTWRLVSSTVVRKQGKRTGVSALADGTQIFVGGPATVGANDARLIIIRPARSGSSSGSGSSTHIS